MMKHVSRLVVVMGLFAGGGVAFAQAQLVPKEDSLAGAKEEDVQGWNKSLAGTATLNLVSNSSVVGQVDGTSMLLGLGISGAADYVHMKSVFRSTLSISESVARTPVLDEYVKTNDIVQLEGIYNYFLTKKGGLYGRLAITTSLFPATDVRAEPTTWLVKGEATPLIVDGQRLRLADAGQPLTLNQSVGAFYDPKRSEKVSVNLRLGVGGRETFAKDVLVIDDDKNTAEVELVRLSNVFQLGVEAFGGVSGKLEKGKVTYRTGVSVLFPFVNNDKDNRSAGQLTRIGFEGNLTVNVFEWMSLVYNLSVTKDAQLFPKGQELTQVQNNLLLTFKYAFVEKKKKKAEPTAAETELAEAKARAETAETKLKTIETDLATCKTQCTTPPAPAPAPATTPTP
jgi:hypothetical protein